MTGPYRTRVADRVVAAARVGRDLLLMAAAVTALLFTLAAAGVIDPAPRVECGHHVIDGQSYPVCRETGP